MVFGTREEIGSLSDTRSRDLCRLREKAASSSPCTYTCLSSRYLDFGVRMRPCQDLSLL